MKIRGHRVEKIHLVRPRELLGLILGRPSPRRVKASTQLKFLQRVLGLERFHYGFWDGEPATLEGLKAAQRSYSDRLRSWIPKDVKSILDVGCGIGTDALELGELDYEVEGLSPDPFQQQEFVSRTGLPFYLSRFQDLEPIRTYDLVLMSESAQYIWLGALFEAVRRVARPGGYLLISDYFVIAHDDSALTKSGHLLDDFLARARDCGLVLERQEDITDRVTPTLDLAAHWYQHRVVPGIEVVTESVSGRHPRSFRVGRALLRPLLKRVAEQREMLDSEGFSRTKRYLVMLFKVG